MTVLVCFVRRTIMDDPFIRNYVEDLLKKIRTQVSGEDGHDTVEGLAENKCEGRMGSTQVRGEDGQDTGEGRAENEGEGRKGGLRMGRAQMRREDARTR